MIADQEEFPSKQGSASSGWLILDYGYLIVHIMTPQLRNFYKLEKRWKDAEIYDFSPYLTELYGVDRGEYNGKNSDWSDGDGVDEDESDKGMNSSENDENREDGSKAIDEIDAFWS